MRIVGIDHIHACLDSLSVGDAGEVRAWLAEARIAVWRKSADIRAAYPLALIDEPSVTFIMADRTIAVSTLITFPCPVVLVTGVSRVNERAARRFA